ncbi:hypothetical protein MED297_12767 [Reinekea blandensis MED297]|uniref:DUF4381 domain-containing protein n=2 Tax=Reinekea TaxID=230494 RepID=A4BEC5_9GAMM|nr:hypothetical protein MED297_12767 [Reinekea blandensis MED297]
MTQAALLNSLTPNVSPPTPSWWPLAPGYWLLSGLLILVIGLIVLYYHRRRACRQALRHLREIQRSESDQQSRRLHELLRWLAIHHHSMSPGLTPSAFALEIARYHPSNKTPSWFNQHYDPRNNTAIDWDEAERLVRALCRRQPA